MTGVRSLLSPGLAALMVVLAGPAGAQAPAFDMSRPGDAGPPASGVPAPADPAPKPPTPFVMPAPPSADAPAANPAPASPPAGAADAPFQMVPGKPAAPALAPTTPSGAAKAAAAAAPDRYIVPLARMVLEGEVDSRAWVIHLTEEEVARQVTFRLSYLNAVVVMPEASRLRVTINGQAVVETPIASSQAPAHIAVPIRPGILRAGANLVRFEAVQRHRTDCTVEATYELWTEIDNAATGLSFAGGRPALTGGLDDLPAVGVDDKGATNIRFVTPGPLEGGGSARVLRAVQGVALRGRYPTPVASVAEGMPSPTPTGTVTVVLGTASVLPRLMGSPPPEARQRGVTRFVNDARLGGPTLVISGPSSAEVDAAIDRLNSISSAPSDAANTAGRFAPDAPLFNGARRVRLADLGITTQEFSGRRFRVRFGIALPADFYAATYGQATLLLDAAFTAAVRPGSHVDFYVNGQIASTLPIASRGGGLFQRQPMKIPLHNFRPGLNRIWVEVVLDTEADDRCLPGATLPGDDRFVLFDSSEFVMDNFARIGRTPDLAALAARAFPYNLDHGPLAVVLARHDAPTVSSAGTLMARLALASGLPLPIDAAPASATLGERPAIFVGGIGQIAAGILDQVGIAETTRPNWMAGPDEGAARPPGADPGYDDVLQRFRNRQRPNPAGGPTRDTGAPGSTPEVYDRWRENLSGGGGIGGVLTSFENWMKRTFDISYSSLRIGRTERQLFEPPPQTSVLIAQGSSPSNTATWTLVAGRTPESLAAGLAQLTATQVWDRIGGQAIAYQASTDTIDVQPVGSFRFIITEPLGFSNFRMIAANWLSINIVPYALMLVMCGIVLGISTALLLRRLGRTS